MPPGNRSNGRVCIDARGCLMPVFRECVSLYLAELGRRGASAHTLRNYASDLEQLAEFLEPPGETSPEIATVDASVLREWLVFLYEAKLTAISIRRKLAAVRS